MDFDMHNALDSFKDGTKEVAEAAQVKTSEFHENYVSKVVPDFGKYGDAAKFAAEMVPGVAEYNAIKDGDWQAFAIAAGIDVASVALAAVTAGVGYAAVKGGGVAAKTGTKIAAKEIAEAGTKKVAKEVAGAGAEKIAKEVAESGVEKAAKEAIEVGVEKTAKETTEAYIKKAEKTVLEVGDKIDKTRFSEYIQEVQKITNREIPSQQKELIDKALRENEFTKLSKEAREVAAREFKNSRASLIQKWEQMTGSTWPRYAEDVFNEAGDVIRRAGQPFDAHHIIELSTGGPNEWWNLHPARFPSEHQNGIHAAENLARKIFG